MPGYFGDYMGPNWWDQYFYPDGIPAVLPVLYFDAIDFFAPGLASVGAFSPGLDAVDSYSPGLASRMVVS